MVYGYVYILASKRNGTIYTGVTKNLGARLEEHKQNHDPTSFTARYGVKTLVWFERYDLVSDAIRREKNIKKWPRQWRVDLIEKTNPRWREITLEFDD